MKVVDHPILWAVPDCLNPRILSQTYYHFLFAIVLPIAELLSKHVLSPTQQIWTGSCGQFDPLLFELREKKALDVRTLPDEEVKSLWIHRGWRPFTFSLHSLELFAHDNGSWIPRPNAILPDRILDAAFYLMEKLRINPCAIVPDGILFISRQARKEKHGAFVRCVPNAEEIVLHLRNAGLDVRHEILEGKPLFEQIRLFASHKTIIAQHGGALSNIVWCSPDAKVIEILPRSKNNAQWNYFEILADSCGISREVVDQGGEFEPVDPSKVLGVIYGDKRK